MATKKQSLVYRLPKHGYEEIDPEEWSDMAICDAYDDAVGETYIKDEKKSQDIKSTYKQFMRNSTQNTNGRLGDGDRQSPRTNHTESQNTRKRIRKGGLVNNNSWSINTNILFLTRWFFEVIFRLLINDCFVLFTPCFSVYIYISSLTLCLKLTSSQCASIRS